jgi:DNA polymerase I
VIPFREVWAVDFEFKPPSHERSAPWVVCMVAREINSGRLIRMWRDELIQLRRAPFDTGPDALMIAYFASAELGCFLELGWPLPVNVLDLYVEHRWDTNGRPLPAGLAEAKGKRRNKRNSLLVALAMRGLAHIDASEKDAMRDLILSKDDWPAEEKHEILDYCQTDVDPLGPLLSALKIDWPRALFRGRYMRAVAHMERCGIPVDAELYAKLAERWDEIKLGLIREVDKDYGVYEGGTLKQAKLKAYAEAQNILWPRTATGLLATDKDTLRELKDAYPQLVPFYELKKTLDQLQLSDVVVCPDGRARCLLSPFGSVTGRNQPSNSQFIFGLARWLRGLAREQPGRALAHIDWSTQEIAIAAVLSGDERMMKDYGTDPYLSFAKAAGIAPAHATKHTHEIVREQCKPIGLGVNYGMGPKTAAAKAGISIAAARGLFQAHKLTYPKFWQWVGDTVTAAGFTGKMRTMFGWQYFVPRNATNRTIQNWPIQSHGAEMMRIAAIAATEAGIEVCCPIHDAFLISAPIERIDEDVAHMREIMRKAGLAITGGFEVRTDAKIMRWPERYMDKRGEGMWQRVMGLLETIPQAMDRRSDNETPPYQNETVSVSVEKQLGGGVSI